MSSTPRKPLLDVNQLSGQRSAARKSVTFTPLRARQSEAHRKRRSNILQEEKENIGANTLQQPFVKETVIEAEPTKCGLREIDGSVNQVNESVNQDRHVNQDQQVNQEDKCVNQFVSNVLDKCVKDLKEVQIPSETKNLNSDVSKSDEPGEDVLEPVCEVNTDPHDISTDFLSEDKPLGNKSTKSDVAGLGTSEPVCEDNTDPQHDISTDLLSEDELLGNESFVSVLADMTRSETELLASFVASPAVKAEETVKGGSASLEDLTDKDEAKVNADVAAVGGGAGVRNSEVRTDRVESLYGVPNFLRRVKFAQRVQNATSILASMVLSPRNRKYRLQWQSDEGKGKVVHDAACSPTLPYVADDGSQTEESRLKDGSEIEENGFDENGSENEDGLGNEEIGEHWLDTVENKFENGSEKGEKEGNRLENGSEKEENGLEKEENGLEIEESGIETEENRLEHGLKMEETKLESWLEMEERRLENGPLMGVANRLENGLKMEKNWSQMQINRFETESQTSLSSLSEQVQSQAHVNSEFLPYENALETSVDLGHHIYAGASNIEIGASDVDSGADNSITLCVHQQDNNLDSCVDCLLSEQHEQSIHVRHLVQNVKENSLLLDELEEMVYRRCDDDKDGASEMNVTERKVVETRSIMTSPIPVDHDTSVASSGYDRQIMVEKQDIQTSPFKIDMHDVSAQYEVATESTQEIQTLPFKVDMHDVSVQYEGGTESTQAVQTSPFKVDTHDVSAQYELETRAMQAVQTSPVKIDTHDTSAQYELETHSMMCSPIKFPQNDISIQASHEQQSIMCSPYRIPVLDVSIQNVAGNQSVCCSPMVPSADQDKSVLASVDWADQCVGTEPVTSSDKTVSACPDVQSVYTEMEELPMINTATCMTPLKIDKKMTKKYTAEDVRKQHPRVIANELETLLLENGRLHTQVTSLEKDRKKLVHLEKLEKKYEEVRTELSTLQTKYEQEQAKWTDQITSLEAQIEDLKLQHDKKMSELRAEYEGTNYCDHFHASQKLVRELQAELQQYTHLIEHLQEAQNVQMELEEAVSLGTTKVKEKTKLILQQAAQNKVKSYELDEMRSECKMALSNVEEERTKLETEREEMKSIVAACRDNIIQLDSDLEETTSKLTETKQLLEKLTLEKQTLLQDHGHLEQQFESVLEEKLALTEDRDRRTEQCNQLQQQLQQAQQQLTDTQQSLTSEVEALKVEIETLQKTNEQRESELTNLQRTLDFREREVDTLERELRLEIDVLERDLYECRERMYIEIEEKIQIDNKLEQQNDQLNSANGEIDRLKESLAESRVREEEVRASLVGVEGQLAAARQSARTSIEQRDTEIADCSAAIATLYDQMNNILKTLNKRAGLQEESREGAQEDRRTDSDKRSTTSLVSQILTAAESSTSDQNEETNITQPDDEVPDTDHSSLHDKLAADPSRSDPTGNKSSEITTVDTPSTESRKKLGFTEHSAFAIVKSNKHSDEVRDNGESDKANGDGAEIYTSANDMAVNQSNEGIDEAKPVQELGGDLSQQLSQVSGRFFEITRVAHLIQKALKSSLNDVMFENEDLQSQVSQSEFSERRALTKLQTVQSDLEKSKATIIQLNEQIEEMTDRFGDMLEQNAHIKRQQEELEELQAKLKVLESEKHLLNSQIAELLEKMEGSRSSSSVDASSQREILTLQTKVDKLYKRLDEKENKIEAISNKASKRIQILEANWKKAETELCRLDELVDNVRAVLVTHDLVKQDRILSRLLAAIDGQESITNLRQYLERKSKNKDK